MPHDIAFLHTSPVHVPTFDKLMRELAPNLRVAHIVREDLLADAQADGADSPPLVARIRQAMGDAGASGASVVVCTCSTIGGAAEDAGVPGGAHATRIDRAMADQAVRHGGKVLLVAALQSTLAPTAALLQSSADRQGVHIEIEPLVVAGAWPHFQAGRHGDYIAAITDAVAQADAAAGVVVLAQASMAPTAERLAEHGITALASPRLGVAHAVALHRQRVARL
jgi:hypothetical protein